MMGTQTSPVWVIIPAAGVGKRMGTELPKQYLKVNNKTLIEHSIDCFLDIQEISGFVVVLSADDEHWQNIDSSTLSMPIHTVIGGSERSDSVLQGLKYLNENLNLQEDTWVMVHDAARPCLSKTDIHALLKIRDENTVGAILASPVRDTMKRSISDDSSNTLTKVSHTESREGLWHALTPQMYLLKKLTEAIQFCQTNNLIITDECSAMEKKGVSPVIVEGSHNNIKVTYPSDIEMVSFLLKHKDKQKL